MQKPEDPTVIYFNVYHSENGGWRTFPANGLGPNQLRLQLSAAVLDGILYWADRGSYVIAYDPEAKPEQQVQLIRDPYDEEKPQHYTLYNYSCVAYRGELRYFAGCACSNDGIPEFNIWKLQDFSSGEWCLVHKLENANIRTMLSRLNTLSIVCFDPFDSDVVYLFNDYTRSVFSYSLKNGTFDHFPEMIVDNNDGRFTKKYLYVRKDPCDCRSSMAYSYRR